jgi:hypothetical protein
MATCRTCAGKVTSSFSDGKVKTQCDPCLKERMVKEKKQPWFLKRKQDILDQRAAAQARLEAEEKLARAQAQALVMRREERAARGLREKVSSKNSRTRYGATLDLIHHLMQSKAAATPYDPRGPALPIDGEILHWVDVLKEAAANDVAAMYYYGKYFNDEGNKHSRFAHRDVATARGWWERAVDKGDLYWSRNALAVHSL